MSLVRVILLIMGICPSFAKAQDADVPVETVQEALLACASIVEGSFDAENAELIDVGVCIGVARAVNSALSLNCWSIGQGAAPYIAANPISPGATLQAFINWARSNPNKWDQDFSSALLFVVAEEFPCEN